MSLTGTLAEFALDDVMTLLAGTSKTGMLVVEGAERSGKVWFDAGLVVGADVAGNRGLAAAVFDLMRLGRNGRFSFQPNEAPSRMGAPESVGEVLGKARTLLAEWDEIAKVVPSLAVEVALVAELATSSVVIEATEWPVIVALGRCRTAAEVAIALRQGEFEVARALKALAERGIATVTVPGTPAPADAEVTPEEVTVEPKAEGEEVVDPEPDREPARPASNGRTPALAPVLTPPSDDHPPAKVVADLSRPGGGAGPVKKGRSVDASAVLKEITNLG